MEQLGQVYVTDTVYAPQSVTPSVTFLGTGFSFSNGYPSTTTGTINEIDISYSGIGAIAKITGLDLPVAQFYNQFWNLDDGAGFLSYLGSLGLTYGLFGDGSTINSGASTVVSYPGPRSDYQITVRGGAILVANEAINLAVNSGSPGGPYYFFGLIPSGLVAADSLTGITKIKFSDSSIDTGLAPVLNQQTAPWAWTDGKSASYSLPTLTFTDANGFALTLAATLANGQPLPSWLSFNPSTSVFSGTAPNGAVDLALSVTATDSLGHSASETVSLDIAYSASTAVAVFQSGSLSGSVVISDNAADISSSLDALQSLQAAGKIGAVNVTDAGLGTIAVTAAQLVSDAQVLHAIVGAYTLSVSNVLSSAASVVVAEDAAGRGANGIATMTPVSSTATSFTATAGTEGVSGLQNMAYSGGSDAVALSGLPAQYLIQVTATGATQITQTSNSQTVTVTGESYLIFGNGAAAQTTSAGAPLYSQFYFIPQTVADAQIAEIYTAALARQPDFPGLEYWENVYNSGTLNMNGIAYQFIVSSEFASSFPAAAAVISTGGTASTTNDSAFITQLYESVLNRAPDAAGLAYWVNILSSGAATPWQALADFAISQENVLDIEALASGGGWMINPSISGGYADAGVQESAQTVLSNAQSSNFVNTNLINTSGLASRTVGPVTVTSAGTLTDSANGATIILSTAIHTVTISGSGDYIVGPASGGAIITDNGGGASIRLSGTGNIVNYGSGDTISGWVAGKDHLSTSTTVPSLYAPTSAAPLNGHTLTTTQPNIIYVGTVSAATTAFAAAANLVYTPADKAGESVTFYGQTGSDTTIYHWVNAATPTAAVTAGELTLGVTLIGITATTLTAADFHS